MHDLVAASAEAERRRERHRDRERERRQVMSIEERENYLARRRQYYQMRRARTASIGTVEGEEISAMELIDKIKHILDAHNPFVQTLRQLAQRDDILDCKLLIKERPTAHSRYALPTASQVAAIIVGGDEVVDTTNRDIIVQTIGGQLMNVKEFSGYYDPLQYPLLLPYGTYGWDSDCRTVGGTRVICCDYYVYMLQIETQKLRFIRTHQQDIRAELYQGLQDSLNAGEDDAGNVGRRTILPSSFVGSPRDMYQRYQDAMSMVKKFDQNDKLNTPDDYDHIVRAKIPDKNDEPMLYEAVMRHMIHGPCGEMNVNAPCMKNGTCKKNYPKLFAPCTIQGTDSYPVYRRRDDNRSISLDRDCDVVVDNGFQRISDVLSDERNSRIMLTEFFRVYNEGQESNQYLYSEFPKYYRWMSTEKVWQKRRSQQKVIGRIYALSPNEGERFYLRILLNHVRGPTIIDDLLTVNNFHYPTFKQAAEKHGFLEEDDSIRQCLIEARAVRIPSALRTLFGTILLYCQPTGVRRLWEENYP
ncbi:UNVERIFIED_CONTAM: hypothetical protein Sradi_3846500 [Sesamum radiatum]|uniref:Helitron helicase-like domain-containing protein n=1 Tax=Sesamum radiatum TaxID=300843 RepID=A0AAW2Q1X8_SESRA